ncbi:MAG: gamma-glutamyl-gamma-aminobutyrate hydrolase family protein [Bacteroidota bacterium]
MNRPIIAVTGPDKGGTAAWGFTALNIWLAGGKPMRIRPKYPKSDKAWDGIVIGGGSDVDPELYNPAGTLLKTYVNQTLADPAKSLDEKVKSFFEKLSYPLVKLVRIAFSRKSPRLDKARDELETQLIYEAMRWGKPILGICRGAQLTNVVRGGTLYEDIRKFYYETPNPYSIFPVKKIFLNRSSDLYDVLGETPIEVNALHHQAVKETGDGLVAAARESNEVIQAIEAEENTSSMIMGVQWHPEYLILQKRQRRLFEKVVQEARNVEIVG